MSKILIFTTSTGQGHNQAANSLKLTLESQGHEVVTYDFLENNSKFLNTAIVKGYELSASYAPFLYGLFYKITDIKIINKISPYFMFPTKNKILNYIKEINPDLIMTTHPLSINIICGLKEKGTIDIPIISIVTDFKSHYCYINKFVDAYIAGSDFTKDYLISRGINKDKIYVYGIPIKKEFYLNNSEIMSLKDSSYFNILLMGGSMGLNNIKYVLEKLITNPRKLRITVVCGNNKKLKNTLTEKYSTKIKDKKIYILGFTKDVSDLMDYCDVIISKPGGLTVTESIVKNIPIIVPFSIPGQEKENIEFLLHSGCGIYTPKLSLINDELNKLIDDKNELKNIKNNMKHLRNKYSLTKIATLCNQLINKRS